MKIWFWKTIMEFAYARLRYAVGPVEKAPVGLPAMRDPQFPCRSYTPELYHTHKEIARLRAGSFTCAGDGHYLCKSCLFFEQDERDLD